MKSNQFRRNGSVLMNVILFIALMAVIAIIALQASELWKYIGS